MSSAANILIISMTKKNILNFLLKMSLMLISDAARYPQFSVENELISVLARYPQFSVENECDVNFCCSKVSLS